MTDQLSKPQPPENLTAEKFGDVGPFSTETVFGDSSELEYFDGSHATNPRHLRGRNPASNYRKTGTLRGRHNRGHQFVFRLFDKRHNTAHISFRFLSRT